MSEATDLQPLSEESDDALFKKLKAQGLKLTAPRASVLQFLLSAGPHPLNADQIRTLAHDSGIVLSQAAIYRALREFEQGKIVLRERFTVEGNGKARFTLLRAEPVSALRCHCRGCGTAIALADQAFIAQLVRQARIGQFDMALARLAIEVTCNSCMSAA